MIETIISKLNDNTISNKDKLQLFLQVNGKVSASRLHFIGDEIKKYEVYSYIINETKELDCFSKNISLSMRIAYLTDRENSYITHCNKCNEPILVFKRLQKVYRKCAHKMHITIDLKKAAKKRFDDSKKNLISSLDKKYYFLSDNDFNIISKNIEKNIINNIHARIPITKRYISYIHDLIIKTENFIKVENVNKLKLSERFYCLKHNFHDIPKCEICNKNNVKFINRVNGYMKTCKKCYKKLFQQIWSEKNKRLIDKLIDSNKYEIISYPKIVSLEPLIIKCKKCGKISEKWIHNGKLSNLDKLYLCNFCEKQSIENDVYEFINSIFCEKIIHRKDGRKIIPPQELDIYIPSKKLAIEFDGLYWHSELEGKDKHYHLYKTEECEKRGIQLIHIFEDEWIEKQDIVKSRLKNLLGISSNKCYARQCEVKEVSSKESFNFQEANHIQGAVNSKVNLGLYYKDELISLMTFSKPRFDKKHEWELVRFCNKLGWHIPGSASKLLSYFEKTYHPKNIVSYADRRWSRGNVYEKIGFKLDHISKPDYWYVKSGIRYSCVKYQKHKLSQLLENFDPEKTEVKNMLENGYSRIWDCGNLVFVKGIF